MATERARAVLASRTRPAAARLPRGGSTRERLGADSTARRSRSARVRVGSSDLQRAGQGTDGRALNPMDLSIWWAIRRASPGSAVIDSCRKAQHARPITTTCQVVRTPRCR